MLESRTAGNSVADENERIGKAGAREHVRSDARARTDWPLNTADTRNHTPPPGSDTADKLEHTDAKWAQW